MEEIRKKYGSLETLNETREREEEDKSQIPWLKKRQLQNRTRRKMLKLTNVSIKGHL